MSSEIAPSNNRLSDEQVKIAHREHGSALRRFLIALLRDNDLAEDAFQNAMGKLIVKGHTANEGSMKAWLFQVAYNEAMMIRRRRKNQQGLVEKAAWVIQEKRESYATSGADKLLQKEQVEEVRSAIQRLPRAQRQILKMRIYQDIKFKDIATKLEIPMGTVLSRMHAATKQLKRILEENNS